MANQDINLQYALKNAGIEYIKILKQILIQEDSIATGNLIKSLKFEVVGDLSKLVLIIKSLPYLNDIDQGTKPGDKIAKELYEPIKKWMIAKRIGQKLKKSALNRYAWNISKKIETKGIKGKFVLQKAQQQLLHNTKIIKGIASGAKLDLEKIINDALKNI